jgi:hypothetical protein
MSPRPAVVANFERRRSDVSGGTAWRFWQPGTLGIAHMRCVAACGHVVPTAVRSQPLGSAKSRRQARVWLEA